MKGHDHHHCDQNYCRKCHLDRVREARAEGLRAGLEEGLKYMGVPPRAPLWRYLQLHDTLPGKCPKCGEPDTGLFSGESCDACGWTKERTGTLPKEAAK